MNDPLDLLDHTIVAVHETMPLIGATLQKSLDDTQSTDLKVRFDAHEALTRHAGAAAYFATHLRHFANELDAMLDKLNKKPEWKAELDELRRAVYDEIQAERAET